MPILNYTTTIAVAKTLAEIQQVLAAHGAGAITTRFDRAGVAVGIDFVIATRFGDQRFRLPANIDGVYAVLERQYEDRQIAPRFVTREQAARVTWRILKDWIEAQVAIIEAGMAPADEVFLPYMLLPSGETVYERAIDSGMKLLPAHRD